MNLRDFENPVTEAPMTPQTFAGAVEAGQKEGVLVGYEFEVGIPASFISKKEDAKDYLTPMLQHIKNYEIVFDTIDYVDEFAPKELDKMLRPKADKKPKFSSFKEAAKGKSKINFDYYEDRVIELMCKMFPLTKYEKDCAVKITNKFDQYFEIIDAKSLYDKLSEYVIFDEYEDEESSYDKAAEKLSGLIEKTFNTKVKIFYDYHESTKKLDRWYIEPDTSLKAENDDDAVLEVVTPPMPSAESVSALKSFYTLAKENGFYTGKQFGTGLHINVSIPKKLDLVKLALFLGDKYLLKLFDREDIEYTWSMVSELQNSLDGDNLYKEKVKTKRGKVVSKTTTVDLKKLKNIAEYISSDHYANINYNGKYISFRHAGGDYLNDYDNVLNVVGRFVRAMIVASDPDIYKKEYMKKLTALLGSTKPNKPSDLDLARKYLNIMQVIKTKGYPVIVGSGLFNLDRWDMSASWSQMTNLLDVSFWSDRYKRDLSAKAKKIAKQNIINYYADKLPSDSPLLKMYAKATQASANLTYMVPPYKNILEVEKLIANTQFPHKGKYTWNEDYSPIYHVEYVDPSNPLVADEYRRLTREYKEIIANYKPASSLDESKQAPIYYFAYGMLTDPDYLPGAELMGVAELRNFKFTMYAYANVEPETGSKVYGTLWKVDRNLLSALDQIEAYPELYDRRTYPVYLDGEKYPAEVYLMTPGTLKYIQHTTPKQQYINTILKGYNNAGVPTSQLYDALYYDDFYYE